MNPKVSIIIPVYNTDKYLVECLDSVIDQTLPDIEIIIINDGSTDCSKDILNLYKKSDDRIVLFENNENRGTSFSRNLGIEHSKGTYTYFFDSDDVLALDALEKLYDRAERNRLQGVFFSSEAFYDFGTLEGGYMSNKILHVKEYAEVLSGPELFMQFVQNEDLISAIGLQFWRLDFLKEKKLNFYEGITVEDVLFTFLALMKSERVSCTRNVYHRYRQREGSATAISITDKRLVGIFTCYYEMLTFWQKSSLSLEVNQAIDRQLTKLFYLATNYYDSLKGSFCPENAWGGG